MGTQHPPVLLSPICGSHVLPKDCLPQVFWMVIVHLSHNTTLDGTGNVLDVHEIAWAINGFK